MSRTLLLADDSSTIRRLIELTLAGEDIAVVAVNDGDEAIAAIARNPPDIVLADVGVPGRSGYDVARYVQETPALAHIPVLLLIDAFEPIDQVRAEAVGSAGVLAKPLEPERVIRRVRELLDRRSTPAPGTGRSPEPPRPASLPELERLWQESAASAEPAPPIRPATPLEVESYFDRLDRAIAALSGAAASPPIVAPPAQPPPADLSPVPISPPPSSPVADWPEMPVPGTALPPAEMAEEVARLVIERLTDRVVRETVGRIVPEMAERLIREEIERIKRNIK